MSIRLRDDIISTMPRRKSSKKPSHTFIKSNKGKNLLVIDDYIYNHTKINSNVTYWSCKVKDCNAGAHTKTSTNQLIKQTGDVHCHLPSPEEVQIRLFKNVVKARVKEETIPIGQIYEEELGRAKLSTTALAQISTANQARKYIDLYTYKDKFYKCVLFYHRLGAGLNLLRRQDFPVLPTTIDFNIPKRFSLTNDEQSFIVADRISRSNITKRMIVFGTDQQLSFLFNCSHILIDGTFKSCPKVFKQVLSIHGMKYNQSMFASVVSF